MGAIKWIIFLVVPITVAVVVLYCCSCSSPVKPVFAESGWWGRGNDKDSSSTTIEPFKVKVSNDVLNDLKMRLLNARTFESLPGSNFEYGFNTEYMKEVVEYWREKYDWRAQEAKLNEYPQFTTVIEGIEVHFIHVKPQQTTGKVRPLMLIHGWPGSVWEFYKLIPMLTGPGSEDSGIQFELIIPSIPGYGFSEAPHRMGFNVISAARVFHKLLKRLGHTRYYIQGGDWGSPIALSMARLYESNVIGVHINFAIIPFVCPGAIIRQFIGGIYPSLIYTPAELEVKPTMFELFVSLMRESGYMHLQATRPDTLAYSITDSPVGLAAYILEKFGVWSNPDNRFCLNGCITKHFTLDEVLTNVMIYWVTGNVVSSVRFYREYFTNETVQRFMELPVTVPSAVSAFPHELVFQSESLTRVLLHKLIQFTRMPRGGHFAAFEEPRLLADDVIKFIKTLEKQETA